MRGQAHDVSLNQPQHAILCAADARSPLSNGFQHRLDIRGRAGNHAQNLTRRSLLFQRLFEFVEQPDVFDGDHGLVGEGFEQFDLRRSEWPHLHATCDQCSNDFLVQTKRNSQESAYRCLNKWKTILLANVRNMKCAMLAHPTRCWFVNTDRFAGNWYGYRTEMTPHDHGVALMESQHHVIDATNLCGALDDRIEHRLHVRGRSTDDAEHLSRCGLMFQGLAQFRVALLNLFEQPHVLDGNDGLVGEGFQEFDLPI